MTPDNISEVLKEQLCQILEGVAFMFIESDTAPLPTPAPGIEARLNFSGPTEGVIWLALSVEGSNRLAAGMLGRPLEEPLGPDEAAPAEFLNILGNWVLDALWGNSEIPFQVAVPRVEAKPLENTVVWSLPATRRAIVLTDAECTVLCGITLNEEGDASV
jgi:hypothetical protein